MISDSFDMESEAIITPSSFFGEKGKICDIAIATFSSFLKMKRLVR